MNYSDFKETYGQDAQLFLCAEAEAVFDKAYTYEAAYHHIMNSERVFAEWIKENVKDWEEELVDSGFGIDANDIKSLNNPVLKGGVPYLKGTWCCILNRELFKMFELLVEDIPHWVEEVNPYKETMSQLDDEINSILDSAERANDMRREM